MSNRLKIGLLAALLVVWAWAAFFRRAPSEAASPPAPAAGPAGAAARAAAEPAWRIPDAVLKLDRLQPASRGRAGELSRNIFEYAGQAAAAKAAQAQAELPPPPPPPKPAPPPVRFYGFADNSRGGRRVFLTDGDDIFIAKEGDVFSRRYRLAKVGKDNVEVEEIGSDRRWVVPLEQP